MRKPEPAAERVHPLTRAQERLFFLHQLDTDAGMYLFPVHLNLRGPLDVTALRGSLADVVNRHDILRSTIEVRGQRPVQIVGDTGFELRWLDLGDCPEPERSRREREAVERETNAPFDFGTGLARGLLVRRGDEDHLLLLGFHHIIFDGWSCGVLLGELDRGYRRHRGEPVDPVEPLAVQYGEYAEIEARREPTAASGAQEEFWKRTLTPVPPNLRLPTDRPRPTALSGKCNRVWTYLDAESTTRLGRCSRQQRATVYMLLLAAYQVLLGRLGGQTDFCVGGATSGRHDPVTHPMIGTLVNELVYRSDYEPGITFVELIARVRRRALDVYRHDRLPFERVVEVATPARSLSHHPLFQHAVTLQPQGPEFEPEGIEVRTVDSGAEGSALDIATSFHEEGDRLACVVDFSADLWEQSWGEAFAADLTAILRALADDPARPVDEVELSCAVRQAPARPRRADTVQAAPAAVAPPEELEQAKTVLLDIWKETLGIPSLDADENFFDIGGDSLVGLRVVAAARRAGYSMRPRHMFVAQTVTDLAALLVAQTPGGPGRSGAARTDFTAARVMGRAPLLPIQSWFLTGPAPEAGHYNYSNLFDVAPDVDEAHLSTAIDTALAHHDAFRLRFHRSSTGEWAQSYDAAPPTGVMRVFDFSRMTPQRSESAFDRAVKTCQSSIGLVDGPLVSCALFTLPGGHRKLLIAAHHLIMEPASMGIVADDISTACEQLARQQEIELLPQHSSYRDWGMALEEVAVSEETRSDAGYWRKVMESASSRVRVDRPDGRNDVASQTTLADSLDEATTRCLRFDVTAATGATLTEIVLAGAAAGLRPLTDGEPLLVDFETHGREDIAESIDLSRTVGWFAALFPVTLPAPDPVPRRGLEAVGSVLRSVPGGGLGHGLLTFMTRELPLSRNRVGVTYLGAVTSGERPGTALRFAGFPEHDRAPRMPRPHELEIGAMVTGEELRYSITYSTDRYPESRIRELLAAMRGYFERLAAEGRPASEMA
ncbi:condensation domain-containing protein [Streptomyces sp. ML-6]|uniref:condensation domain-containing protein n=1 Tax=Streptomyces sp. ML-6 TaxID=2982693 RepID=UPI0024BF628D|nr:condensation domain-containing protein [Streptomyces sp. ML-6]MDK0517986.1 condensation domain-containing protein [Streptomyces sp. ML-6]